MFLIIQLLLDEKFQFFFFFLIVLQSPESSCPWMVANSYDWIYITPAIIVLFVNSIFLFRIMWVSHPCHVLSTMIRRIVPIQWCSFGSCYHRKLPFNDVIPSMDFMIFSFFSFDGEVLILSLLPLLFVLCLRAVWRFCLLCQCSALLSAIHPRRLTVLLSWIGVHNCNQTAIESNEKGPIC